jgi:diguanylate cyclase
METEHDVNLILELFHGSAIFSELDGNELKILAGYCEITSVKKDEALFKPGDTGSCLYIIADGSVAIHGEDDRSSRTEPREMTRSQHDIVARFKAGESFGELEFFNASTRSAYAIAETDTTVLRCPGKGNTLEELLEGSPKLTAHLMHNFLNSVADRIRTANDLIRENSVWVRELRNQMYTDKLTGLYNRTYLEENLDKYRGESKLGLLMIKPDNFKIINDTFGHDAGDMAIKEIARHVEHGCEAKEVAVRFMGNEFAVILPDTDRENAGRRAEFFQETVCAIDLSETVGVLPVPLTASVGVCVLARETTETDTGSVAGSRESHNVHLECTDSKRAIEVTHETAMRGRTIGGRKILYVE